MAVELRRAGLHLSGTALWLDAHRKSELSFVSHAHADHIARHERVIATAATLRFMQHRLGKVKGALPAPYNRPFELGPLVLELLPAGHVLGSAQLRVVLPDGTRVVYTGDLNLAATLTAEPAQIAECDVLVIESTYGRPKYAFPPREQTFDAIAAWCRTNLERGVTPILLAYPLGKSQETVKALTQRGLKLCAHTSIHSVCQIYGELGMPLEVRRYDGRIEPDEVGLFPPHIARAASLQRLKRATAVLTGWALDGPVAARRYGADIAFPVSDHADFPSLMRYARASGATEVITHHGFADELAEALRKEGFIARAVHRVLQLPLL
ncbi:MAG: MBL fold metallo-hydrolase [Myxococcaceae bacterium]|nr:MBL fold metallo-hydrolase [Myxococcaceae bacterium]